MPPGRVPGGACGGVQTLEMMDWHTLQFWPIRLSCHLAINFLASTFADSSSFALTLKDFTRGKETPQQSQFILVFAFRVPTAAVIARCAMGFERPPSRCPYCNDDLPPLRPLLHKPSQSQQGTKKPSVDRDPHRGLFSPARLSADHSAAVTDVQVNTNWLRPVVKPCTVTLLLLAPGRSC